jgi:hypothetical protein
MPELEIFTAAVSSNAYVYLSLVAILGYTAFTFVSRMTPAQRSVTLVHRAI